MAYCTLGRNFLPENRASESQPPCPTSMYLLNTLGWRWARRELSEQPQRSTWNTGSNVRNQKLPTCEGDIPTRGAGGVREVFFCARKTWGRRGHVGIPPPPGVRVFQLCPNWRLAVGAGAHGGKCQRERGKDDRCSPRRSWCGSTTQLQRDRRPPRRRQASRPC